VTDGDGDQKRTTARIAVASCAQARVPCFLARCEPRRNATFTYRVLGHHVLVVSSQLLKGDPPLSHLADGQKHERGLHMGRAHMHFRTFAIAVGAILHASHGKTTDGSLLVSRQIAAS